MSTFCSAKFVLSVSFVLCLFFAASSTSNALAECSENFYVPGGGFLFPASGGGSTMWIEGDPGCSWSAYSTNTSMTYAVYSSGPINIFGYSTLEFVVTPNTAYQGRTAYYVVQQQSYPYKSVYVAVNQEPATGCGDGVCNGNETNTTCPDDCRCGNNICEQNLGESASTCLIDCHCGNNVCESTFDENDENCHPDCHCGNGLCDYGENIGSCFVDCGSSCAENCQSYYGLCMGSIQQQCSDGCYQAVISQVGEQICAMVPEYCQGLFQQCVTSCFEAGSEACSSQYDYCMAECN